LHIIQREGLLGLDGFRLIRPFASNPRQGADLTGSGRGVVGISITLLAKKTAHLDAARGSEGSRWVYVSSIHRLTAPANLYLVAIRFLVSCTQR
jgi:hypothetical protein